MIKNKKIVFGITIATGMAVALASMAFAQTTPVVDTSLSAAIAGPAAVGSTLEEHINSNGTVLVRGAKITSISGGTIDAAQNWGAYNMNWVVNTGASTSFLRRGGTTSSMGEFSVGDYISFTGPLDTTQSVATVDASVVRDFSIQLFDSNFSGTVSSVNTASSSFMLQTSAQGNVTVNTTAETKIWQGSATTTFASIAVGQTISSTSGLWNNLTDTLQAATVRIYMPNQGLLNKRTFVGTLGSLPGATAPTTFSFTADASTTYTVNVAANTSLLSNSWNPITLSQMSVNDTIRIYGAIEPTNTSTMDAYVVRDTSVK